MSRPILIIASMLYGLTLPAQADGIPRYNVEKYCVDVSEISGGSAMIYNGCINIEQQSYNTLKADWAQISSKSRYYCNEVAVISGGSYNILEGCIELETNAANTLNSFEY
ncbi:hypothetical protein [Natronohydrobacter thiooxidans]|uniref:hypothetical protein n=1 Tax=Natronohydrobacter thiooxidans TaxID=87172 RepID=UPI0008FF28AE|nr:hypothetical protein [Natronohydrobacter thiooxidans]